MVSRCYLDEYLAPLVPWLEDDTVSEIAINPDGRVWIEREGQDMLEEGTPAMPVDANRLARAIAGSAGPKISEAHPILSARTDWQGRQIRVQAVLPPAIEVGAALSFRRYRAADRTLGEFQFLSGRNDPATARIHKRRETIATLVRAGDPEAALAAAMTDRLNVLISGGTSSAKTTLARAMIARINPVERLITIEDARELHPHQPNRVELVADRDEASARTATRLLQSALRMRPDRIVVGELRGREAWTFLEAINTGHGGSITTIHAEHPEMALERIAMMVTGAGIAMPYGEVLRYVRASIDLIVQLARIGGRRGILEIALPQRSETHAPQDLA